MTDSTPSQLWIQADREFPGDHRSASRIARYNELMREYGHIVPRCEYEVSAMSLDGGWRCDLEKGHTGGHLRFSHDFCANQAVPSGSA